ncbi:MAG TPA: hypothetical protein VLA48_02750 [Nitrososphaeraceae archaeon]|nr:hypothetical protein [Nitrososphaeraceae archaeon]
MDYKKQYYIRLLSYDNGLKVIDYVESLKVYENYANITVGGISLQILEEDFGKVVEFIESLNDRYEITTEHPTKIEANIVKNLKENGVI